MDEQTKKLHLAYLLKCMEELKADRSLGERIYLKGVIAEHRQKLSRCYRSSALTSYAAVQKAYQQLAWHHGEIVERWWRATRPTMGDLT